MTDRRALLSVSDKTGIVELGRGLVDRGWDVVSTGGTARTLRDAGLPVTDVAEITGHPEMMDGRVKTLHPAIHAGLLARRDRDDDTAALEEHGYRPIDLVAVNLYPFRETVSRGDVPVAAAMEKVDIGGPTMIRAAAKSHRDVWVVVDPSDYPRVLQALDEATEAASGTATGTPSGAASGAASGGGLRRHLAAKVFRHISGYDGAVADYLEGAGSAAPGGDDGVEGAARESQADEGEPGGAPRVDAETVHVRLRRVQSLRYGENPDQEASFHRFDEAPGAGLTGLRQHHGKELSYNNILDLDGALLSLSPFALSPRAAVCIVKHTTPCGLALGSTVADAYRRALATDPTSAFGSVIAANRPVDLEAAEAISELFVECLVAPAVAEDAMQALTRKKNIRVLTFGGTEDTGMDLPVEPDAGWWAGLSREERASARFMASHGRVPHALAFRSVYGGVLLQAPPLPPFYGAAPGDWRVVTERSPTRSESDDLAFAWAAVFGVKSNAILLARDGGTVGIGAGQMSRVDASRIAVMKAREAGLDLEGAVLASDAFFPFRDGVEAAAEAGVRAIVQPGGSVRDDEVVAAADEHGIAMVFTGRRLFRH